MKLSFSSLVLCGVFTALPGLTRAMAVSLDDIQFWTGAGTNRAALVIHWSAPEVRNNTAVPDPAAEKSLVWGYRWNGEAKAQDLFDAVAAADHRLFFMVSVPYPGVGPVIYSLGYDLNNNGVFGMRLGTNTFAENAFTNGQRVVSLDFGGQNADNAQSLDTGDVFWSGASGPTWDMWKELDGLGGFTNAPDRGANPYWTPADPDAPGYGTHGEWQYTSSLQLISLHDGSWLGFTVSAGGYVEGNPTNAGTLAFNYHKHAPLPPEPAPTNSAYAMQIIAAQGPFGGSPYDDTNSVLGAPTTRFYESALKPATRSKLIEAPYNIAPDQVTKLLLTMSGTNSYLIAKFDHRVYDVPANPYGIDFEVFGNAFYSVVSGGFSSDTANMNNFTLGTGALNEPTKVSVSPGCTGQPGEDANDPSTWPWYRYDNGPYADTEFPTHAYKWNRTGTNWTDEVMDFTKPVNPMMRVRFKAGGLKAPDAINLYDGAGGGTGFDLKPSGFAWIQYVKVEGLFGFSGGEVDAFSIVRPMTVGDTMSISPANLTNNTAQLFFQKPGAENQNVLTLSFTTVSDIAQVATARLGDSVLLGSVIGTPLNALQLSLSAILNTNAVSFQADIGLAAGSSYTGNGNDLRVAQWTGTSWSAQPFTFNATSNTVVFAGVTNLSALVISQIIQPHLNIQASVTGYAFQFTPVANCSQTLERSTNFVNWDPVLTVTPTNSTPMVLQDTNPPVNDAFYRVKVTVPP